MQLWDQWNLPEVERNEGDDESEESLQVSEPDELPEAPAPTQTSEPFSRPTQTRNPPDLLSPKMTGQYHGGQSTFAIYLVKVYDNVTAFFDDMAYLMRIADKDTCWNMSSRGTTDRLN